MKTIHPPVFPFRGLRGVDGYGIGGFGAPRDEGQRRHEGTDYITVPGDVNLAPVPCKATARGLAYPHNPKLPDLHSLHLQGLGDYENWHFKILYVKTASDVVGVEYEAGAPIGICED